MKIWPELQELLFPTRCLGCHELGLSLCSSCLASWHPHIYRGTSRWQVAAPQQQIFPIYSAITYSPVASKVLLAAKESGIALADQLLQQALSQTLRIFLREQSGNFLVPIPSRKSAARLRGRQFVVELTEILGKELLIPTANLLSHQRKVRDQSSLTADARHRNIAGSLRAHRYLPGRAIIIDDLVTSGATLQEAARALTYEGIEVAGAVTACVAQPLR
jgi:predicted amidophosphoribosyltransferase